MNFFLFLLLLCSNLFATLDIYTTVSKDSIFVGEKVLLTINIKETEILELNFPELDVDNQDISLSTVSSSDSSLVLSLQFWRTGNHRFPSIKINYINEDSISKISHTLPIPFNILERYQENDSVLRESKTNIKVNLPFTKNQILLISVILITIASSYILLRKKKKFEISKHLYLNTDFFNKALIEIEQLNLPERMESIELEVFYLSLSNIIKSYLLERFFFNATKMTTSEILTYLQSKNINVDDLENLLQEADLCKFAQQKYGATRLVKAKTRTKALLLNFESINF